MALTHARYDEVDPTKQQRNNFSCGRPTLNRWLATQARQIMESRDAVTDLLVDDECDPVMIAGYHALSSGELTRQAAPDAMARRAADPIPVIRMGRFAIDQRYQGTGLGAELLREALLGAVNASAHIGARLMLVDALDETAREFYERFGFEESPVHPYQVVIDLRSVARSTGIDDA